MTGQTLRRLGLAALFGAAVALPVPAIAQDKERQDKDSKERSADKHDAKAEKAKWTLKVFELKHRTPDELNQILTMRWAAPQPAFIAPPGVPIAYGSPAYPVREGTPGTIAQPVMTTERTSAYRGQSGQMFLAFDPEAKLFFVRGPEDQVRKVEELVKAIDVPNDQLQKADFNGWHLIAVKRDKLPQVTRTLSTLQINNRVMNLGDAAVVVVRSDGEDDNVVEQAREVIAKYDAGTKSGKEADTTRTEKPEKNDK